MKKLFLTLSLLMVFASSLVAAEVIKKSKTGICHAPGTTYYNQTKSYTAYKTLKDCLDSGGRLPKK
jgi:hypothetical protein